MYKHVDFSLNDYMGSLNYVDSLILNELLDLNL